MKQFVYTHVTRRTQLRYWRTRWRVSARATLVLIGTLLPYTTARAQQNEQHARGTAPPVAMPSISPTPQATPVPDATVVATNEYRRSGIARTVRDGDFLVVPFGKTQPVLSCTILRTCVIRLQPGERLVSAPALGDSERWLVAVLATGPEGDTPLVTVKPTDCDITTDLILPTDRRLYIISLDAPPCTASPRVHGSDMPSATASATNNADARYTRYLGFYYPDDRATPASMVLLAQPKKSPSPIATSGIAPEHLNFNYAIERDRRFPWAPAQVFDDGIHTYIHLPAQAEHTPAPVFFLVNDDGSRSILNYTVSREYYIADRVVEHAQLVIADGGRERTLTLINRKAKP